MPQLFQVLKCYKCSVFQVHQTKKSNKWECKLCGEKQSIKRHYGLGSGKECRLHVQKLNKIRGEIEELNESIESNRNSDEELESDTCNELSAHILDKPNNESKWSNFIDKTDHVKKPDSNENMFLGNTEIVLEVPAKKRRKFKAPKLVQQTTANSLSYLERNESESQQSNLLCKFDLDVAGNTFSKVYSSEINKTIPPEVPEKENQPVIYKLNDFSDKEDKTIMHGKNLIKTYFPTKLNNSSKWAQFAESDDIDLISQKNSSGNKSVYRESSPGISPSNLFTLCDDSKLDSVLDF